MATNGNGENVEEQVTMATEEYIKLIDAYIIVIKKGEPKDRVGYALAIARCINGMSVSTKGWAAWLNNLEALDQLSLEELTDVYPKMKECALKFLEADVDISRKKLDQVKAKFKNRKKQPDSKPRYVQ
jgi:hypothetical protein